MVVISKSAITEFVNRFPAAEAPLAKWYHEVKAADWKDYSDMKRTFNSVDAVGNDRFVFNVGGNNFRLIALIIFRRRTIFILFIGTHAEYNKIDATNINFK